jgi:hypothetical protein
MTTDNKQDWLDWHKPYDDPDSRLARRLATVQQRLLEALDAHPGPIRLISMCAGQGRDVIPVLAEHPRGNDVTALLVELDPRNAELATEAAQAAGLRHLRVSCADAAFTDNYARAAPADIVLACGIFGNITHADIENTVRHLPMLCAPGAIVLWTRGRWKDNDPTPKIRQWFDESGFEELSFDAPDDLLYSVGANRYRAEPRALEPGVTLFTFFR